MLRFSLPQSCIHCIFCRTIITITKVGNHFLHFFVGKISIFTLHRYRIVNFSIKYNKFITLDFWSKTVKISNIHLKIITSYTTARVRRTDPEPLQGLGVCGFLGGVRSGFGRWTFGGEPAISISPIPSKLMSKFFLANFSWDPLSLSSPFSSLLKTIFLLPFPNPWYFLNTKNLVLSNRFWKI